MHCNQCNTTKVEADFYLSRTRRCKECIKASVRANRLEKIDYYRAFDRARASQPNRVLSRIEYAKTPAGTAAALKAKAKYAATDAARAAKRAYLKSEHGRVSRAESMRKQALKHPEKHAARMAFGNAVRDGRVIPWPVCAIPECCEKPQGHHPDYSRPLDVVWLCVKHHNAAHAISRMAA